MLRFDEKAIKADVEEVLGLRPEVEAAVKEICREGYENIFLVGIGGTYAVAEEWMAYLKGHSNIPIYLENAADLIAEGNCRLGKGSVMVITSVTGNTPEMTEAVNYGHERGAKVLGFVDEKDSPLAKVTDILFSVRGGAYLKLGLVMLAFLRETGEFPEYDTFYSQMEGLGEGLASVQKAADEKAREFAAAHWDDEIHYVIGGGCLKGAAYSYAMCYMEEMLWMRTKSVSAADFFHGTLEVIDRDTNVMLFKGEDGARVQTERVERFLPRVCGNVTVFDTADYPMEGIDGQFRDILTPLVMAAVYARLNVHLEEARKHPMEIRRYYHKLDY